MRGDGIAALGLWPVEVRLGGAVYRIAPLPAVRWIVPLAHNDWEGIFPGLLGDGDGDAFDDALDRGEIRHAECVRVARSAVADVSGLSWWSARTLVQTAIQNVEIAGELVLNGVDPQRVSFGAFVAAVYRVLVRNADEKGRKSIDSDVSRPPPDVPISEIAAWGGTSGFEEMMMRRRG